MLRSRSSSPASRRMPGVRSAAVPAFAVMLAALPLCAGWRGVAAAPLEPFGLEGRVVTTVDVHGRLYAGTLGDGVFRRDLADTQATWVSLGLQGTRIRAVYPHDSGPIGIATTAGLERDPLFPDSARIYCLDMDQPPWLASDSGMTRSEISGVWSLDGYPSPAICGETFAGTSGAAGGVWRRQLGSPAWEHVLDLGHAICNVVRANQTIGHVWAGGGNVAMAPWIARSTDKGDTWVVVVPDVGGDNTCHAIALHPQNVEVAYAGMVGSVIRTSDGGVTWQPTGLAAAPAAILAVAIDWSRPSHLVAGGTIPDPSRWGLWESIDAGATWFEVPPPAPGTSGVSSIVSDPSRAGTFYIGTFGHGVWRYQRVVTGIDSPPGPDPPGLALGRVYPNPIGPRATIEFTIPASLGRERVTIAVHDVNGSLVRTLLEGIPGAGPHRAVWNGTDARGRRMPAGAYFVALRAGAHRLTRRFSLLR